MDLWDMAKSAFKNAYINPIKSKIKVIAIIAIIFIIIIAILVCIILVLNDSDMNGTYNGLSSYSFWWPIGSQEITTDEDGKQYAVGEPSAITISSDYKDRNPERPDHNGIDICSIDTQGLYQGDGYHYIIAAKAGTVTVSHLSDSAGEYVVIDHGNGFVTKYMHMYPNSRKVEVGDTVKQGQILGIMGTTGNSTGPHLHFQIELNGEPVDPLKYVNSEFPRGGGSIDVYNTTLTRSEFINYVSNYKKDNSNYQNNMVKYAGDFYDVCTSNGVNPEFAFAHSCIETGYGSYFIATNNYFGYAAYNTDHSAAASYSSPAESIKTYCDWVLDRSNPNSAWYQESVRRAEEWSNYNQLLVGTPDTNVYVLYITYAALYPTHTPGSDGDPYYWSEVMYGRRCNHPEGSETTIQEKADYAVHTVNMRLEVLQNIFGK